MKKTAYNISLYDKNYIFVSKIRLNHMIVSSNKLRILLLCLFIVLPYWFYSINETKYGLIYNHYKDFDVDSLAEVGDSYYKKNSLDSALVCFSIVSGKYNDEASVEMSKLYAHAFNRCGAIYLKYNSYEKALSMFLRALEICEQKNYQVYIPKIYNNIAHVYYLYKDYATAESYCEKAYELGVKNQDEEIQNIVLKNLIGLNCYLKGYEKAQQHLKLLNKQHSNNNPTFDYYLCISNGAISLKQNKYREALDFFLRSVQYADSCENPNQLKYSSLSNISKAYSYMNKMDSAIYYLEQGENIVSSHPYMDLLTDCYNDLSEIYRQLNDKPKYLSYKEKYLNIADSIFNIQGFGHIKDMQFLHEMDKVEKQIYHLNDVQMMKDHQIKLQQQILFTVVGAFIVILLLLLMLYRQNKRLKESNDELFNKNLEILKSDDIQKKIRQQVQIEHEKQVQPDNSAENKVKYQGSFIGEEEKRNLQEAIQNVMDNTLEYCSVEFNLDRMATLVNSRTKYVSQVINECYGKNFNAFINEYRIKEACRKLIDIENYGGYTIAAIAESVGFKSNANFNLIFKKVTGFTPSVYQNMAKKRQNTPPDSLD